MHPVHELGYCKLQTASISAVSVNTRAAASGFPPPAGALPGHQASRVYTPFLCFSLRLCRIYQRHRKLRNGRKADDCDVRFHDNRTQVAGCACWQLSCELLLRAAGMRIRRSWRTARLVSAPAGSSRLRRAHFVKTGRADARLVRDGEKLLQRLHHHRWQMLRQTVLLTSAGAGGLSNATAKTWRRKRGWIAGQASVLWWWRRHLLLQQREWAGKAAAQTAGKTPATDFDGSAW